MPLQIVIPDSDPLISLLFNRAKARGMGKTKQTQRKRLARLSRDLIRERLYELNSGGDSLAAPQS
jgi:hypothetical protein